MEIVGKVKGYTRTAHLEKNISFGKAKTVNRIGKTP
jgi:hypothetical protein